MELGAYFLSWATYGTRVREGADEKKALAAARRLREPVYRLNERGRAVVEAAILELASHHEWLVVAHDVQESWVHVVVYAVDLPPAQVAGQMKWWATRRLREAGLATGRTHVWTRRPTLCRIADEPTMTPADEFLAERAGEPAKTVGLPRFGEGAIGGAVGEGAGRYARGRSEAAHDGVERVVREHGDG